jgi:E3 ubiquitin-protein ligase BIG BROTHER-like protein
MMSEGSEFNSTIRGSGRYELGGDVLEERDEDRNRNEAEAEEEQEEEEDNEEGDMAQSRVNAEGDIDGSLFDSDEAFAQALQEKEYRDTTARLMALAGIHDLEVEYESDSNDSEENMWQDVDPDNMSYEVSIC